MYRIEYWRDWLLPAGRSLGLSMRSGEMGGIVISGGRVVDPASGMDAVADVAVLDGRIAAIGTGLGDAERAIDATGLVVAPGFIDLHAHGQSIPADRMQAFDGVTTTLDLEAGVLPVASWYRRQAAQGRVLNYGASTNWAFARIGAMTGSNEESSLEAFGRAMRDRRWVENVASETEVAGILDRLTQGLNEGGIGIGILNAYAPGAGVQELTAVCQLAAAHAVPTFTHIAYMSRIDPESAAEAYVRLIGYAGATGAHMHICHFNSSSKTDVERCAVLVAKAQAQGLPITLEAYPYGTGSTVLAAAFFSDPEFEARQWHRLRFGPAGHRRAAVPRPGRVAGCAGRGTLDAGAVAHPGSREQRAPPRSA